MPIPGSVDRKRSDAGNPLSLTVDSNTTASVLPASPTLPDATKCYNGGDVPAGRGYRDPMLAVVARLTVQQVQAVELLVAGTSDASVAKVVQVNRVTITRWRLYNVEFRAALNRRRQEVWGTAADGVRGLLEVAARAKHIERHARVAGDDPAHEPLNDADRIDVVRELARKLRGSMA